MSQTLLQVKLEISNLEMIFHGQKVLVNGVLLLETSFVSHVSPGLCVSNHEHMLVCVSPPSECLAMREL